MNERRIEFNLRCLGLLVLLEAEEAERSNQYRQQFGRYYGVDRLPPVSEFDMSPNPTSDPSFTRDLRMLMTARAWSKSRKTDSAFITQPERAIELSSILRLQGFRLEVVSAQLAWTNDEDDRERAYGAVEGLMPKVVMNYGFDVSWPTCNHSAIIQPGVVPGNEQWRCKLNEYGLLHNYETAAALRDLYLSKYPYPPFDIYLVQKVGPFS